MDPASVQTAVSDGVEGNGLLADGDLDLELVAAPARALIRDRPFVALAGAILAGFLVARVLARR